MQGESQAQQEIELLVKEILERLSAVSQRFAPDNLGMKQWMMERFSNEELADLLQETSIMGLRALDAIGRLEPVNGATISKMFGIPKGTVSKATRRLAAQKLITTESLANNKKEVLFRTTPLGRELYLAHRAFDEQMERGIVRFLNRYSAEELALVARVLQEAAEASYLTS